MADKDHPVGTGIGAVGGGAAGAVGGAAVGGPVGAVVGGIAGAAAGAAAGKGIAHAVDAKKEDEYWRANFQSRPYYTVGDSYELYEPAYRYGWETYSVYAPRTFDEIETDLERDWETRKGTSRLSWERAKLATRDAWHKIERALPGDFDKDGR